MASPPKQSSPPLQSLHLPKKRPSISTSLNPPNSKRRKPSAAPSALRQTSFPPEDASIASDAQYSRSPSVESSIIGSTVTGSAAGGTGKKRGRKGKKDRDDDARSASVRGGKAGTAAPSASGRDAANAQEDEDAPEDVDEDVLEGLTADSGNLDSASAAQQREHMRLLEENFTLDQRERYDQFRRVRLQKTTVRRIVNQTLSQSVPQSVVMAVNGFTKVFIGEILTRARDVQEEWMAANTFSDGAKLPTGEVVDDGASMQDRTAERDKGPLEPDHLREAVRRYKKDREGGGAGFVGLSFEGRENAAWRMNGRRLFR